jgi:hypothetical protein
MALASVSFNTKILKINGRGDAYHSWNRVQINGTKKRTFLGIAPVGLRAPDSVSATNSWASAVDAGFFFGLAMVTIPPYQAMVTVGDAAFCCSHSVDNEPARHRMEWECCFASGMTFVHSFNRCAMRIILPPEVI